MKLNQKWVVVLFLTLVHFTAVAQHEWSQTIDASIDSANMHPVRTFTDNDNFVYVLANYMRPQGVMPPIERIFLNKYDYNGQLIWNTVIDNNGNDDIRAFDMAMSPNGDCFIACGLNRTSDFLPVLIHVDSSGNFQWRRDSTSSFTTGQISQVILQGSLLYLRAAYGIAVFNTNGSEQWSHALMPVAMAVDANGEMIVTSLSTTQSVARYDIAGNLNFSDSTIWASRIATDIHRSIYLMTDFAAYELVKYDSNGVFQWSYDDFPEPPPFGDVGFEVLTDYDANVYAIGLSDTILKFTPDGSLIWTRPMGGTDAYLITAKLVYNNFILVAGTISGFSGYDAAVTLYNSLGQSPWSVLYNSNLQQEFSVDVALDGAGVYLLEDSTGQTDLVKFQIPLFDTINFDLVCVDSVWYEPGNPQLINVMVFNGDINHMNYPSVQIIDPMGDTIGNRNNNVDFFAHLGNYSLIYKDTITVQGITDFSGYTFVMNEGFGDTSAVINFCSVLSIPEHEIDVRIYPNPATDFLVLENLPGRRGLHAEIYNSEGRLCRRFSLETDAVARIALDDLSPGLYFLRLFHENASKSIRFIRQ